MVIMQVDFVTVDGLWGFLLTLQEGRDRREWRGIAAAIIDTSPWRVELTRRLADFV